MAYKVLLVDDEPDLHEALADLLSAYGYIYCGTTDSAEATELIASENPDLILLDVMMPKVNGFRLCEEIRKSGNCVPVIFLTAKSDITDKSIGFDVGANDYVTKPFDSEELLLRIGAHIRRHLEAREALEGARGRSIPPVAVIGKLEVRFSEYRVFLEGTPVSLTAKEFEILALLASAPDTVFTREQIHEHIWGENDGGRGSNNITVLVRRIREKIEKNPSEPKLLRTVQRIGYKISSDDK